MDDKIRMMLFRLIGSAIYGDLLSDKEKEFYNAELLSQVLKIAKYHDILHLVILGLKINGLFDKNNRELETHLHLTLFRYERMNYALNQLCDALEAAGIPFIPLKGSVIKNYYPEPWMRTSCDIDVLIREADLDIAVEYLVKNLGYIYKHKFTHDVSMFTKNGQHIELHYSLMGDEPVKKSFLVLNNIWDMAALRKGYEYWYELPDEIFYFYHIAHMAKHFENGGCGIRSFIDSHILNHRIEFDETKRKNLLEFLIKHLKENEYIIAKMIVEGYTRIEISQELMIQPKRVYYVCDKIKKLLLSYID